MSQKITSWILGILLAIAVIVIVYLGTKSNQAAEFCLDNGYQSGQYKGYDGGFYSCGTYTRYDAETKKEIK